MSITSKNVALIALFCLVAVPLTQAAGVVSVSVKNTNYDNLGQVTESQTEFVEFAYESVEWNSNQASWENEWSFEEDGVGEFELADQLGDVVLIRAREDYENLDLPEILSTVTASPAGGNTTVASIIGNSISYSSFPQSNNNNQNSADNDVNAANNVIATVIPVVLSAPANVVETVAAAPADVEVETEGSNQEVVEISVFVPYQGEVTWEGEDFNQVTESEDLISILPVASQAESAEIVVSESSSSSFTPEAIPVTEAVQTESVDNAIPTLETIPVSESVTTTETIPVTESVTTTETIPVTESVTTTETVPVAESVTTTETVPVAEAASIVEALPTAVPVQSNVQAVESTEQTENITAQ